MNVTLVFGLALIIGLVGGVIGGLIITSFGSELNTSNYVTQVEFQNFTAVQNQTHINMATALANRDVLVQNATLQYVFDTWVEPLQP